eukprot:scaffold94428_cov23-Tisochrysis_lutea.AAC.1
MPKVRPGKVRSMCSLSVSTCLDVQHEHATHATQVLLDLVTKAMQSIRQCATSGCDLEGNSLKDGPGDLPQRFNCTCEFQGYVAPE